MSKYIELTHQAFAAYSARNFGQAINLLCKAFKHWTLKEEELSNPNYNALYDAVEMVENLSVYLTIWERNTYVVEIIDAFKHSLDHLNKTNLSSLEQQIELFKGLLNGVQIGMDFFNNNGLSLFPEQPIVSFELTTNATIKLLKWEHSTRADALIIAFNACFRLEMTSLEQCQKEVQKALDSEDIPRVKALLELMMEQYPTSKKEAFLQLGHVYFQEEAYQKAAESYMKTIVMGTPKELVRSNIQVACNALAAEAENSKEAARWRGVLINFF